MALILSFNEMHLVKRFFGESRVFELYDNL